MGDMFNASTLFRVFDSLNASVFISDIDTNEILFMNKKMKEIYNEDDYDGKHCWEICSNSTTMCDNCPLVTLIENPDEPIVWEKYNEKTESYFQNTDSIIEWLDGRKVHLQHSVDITEAKLSQIYQERQLKRQKLLSKTSMNFASLNKLDDMINDTLKLLGEYLGVNRVYIFREVPEENYFCCDYEWVDKNTPSIIKHAQYAPYSPSHPDYISLIENNYLVISDFSKLEKYKQFVFPQLGTKGFVAVPIFVNEKFWGFLALDNSDPVKRWFKNDLEFVKSITNIFSSGIERRNIENSLFETQQTLRNVIDNVPSAIFWKDKNLIYKGCNLTFQNMLGMSEKDIIGKSDYEMFSNKTATAFFSDDKWVLDNMEVLPVYDKKLVYENGQNIWVKISKIPILDENKEIVSLLGIFDDITKSKTTEIAMKKQEDKLKKSIEEAQKANEAKSEFLSRMSHEIRTPMNAIIGMTNIAKSSKDIHKIFNCLDKIDSSSNHLLSVINDILDMSKIEAKKFELFIEEFNLEKMLMNVCNVVTVRSDEKNQELQINIDNKVADFYIGDSLRLTQVLTNLLSNAIKFTPENGEITLRVVVVEDHFDYSVLRFEIIDSGIGMSKEQVERLFTPFEQADGGIARKYGGTGLGLSITKEIISLMEGNIYVDSEINKGSKFSFEVKLEKSYYEESISLNLNIKDLNVLVIDDSTEILDYFKNILSEYKIKVATAISGKIGIELVKEALEKNKPYNIIFLDWMMPEMDGIETARHINELTSNQTVVILTSIAKLQYVEKEVSELGIKSFLPKPLFPSTIINTINEVIGVPSKTSHAYISKLPDYSDKKILVVEDIDINREIIISFLEDTKIKIDYAENGMIALEKFKENNGDYDLILMDLHMPVMDGYSATEELRKLNKYVPIIAMTANVFKEDIEKCLTIGMNDHLAKPIEYDIVLEKISKYLDKEPGVYVKEENMPIEFLADGEENDSKYLDLDEAMSRFNGNTNLYNKLLNSFKANTRVPELCASLKENDNSNSLMLAHTIKGVSANLCLKELCKQAEMLEDFLRNGLDVKYKANELEECLKETLKRVDKIIDNSQNA